MNNDKFPRFSEPDEDLDFSSIIKKSSPPAFDFRNLFAENFNRNQEAQKDSLEEDEDETTETKKKKRFLILLKKIFPKTLQEESEPKTPILDLGSLRPNISEGITDSYNHANIQVQSNEIGVKPEIFSDIDSPEAFQSKAEIESEKDFSIPRAPNEEKINEEVAKILPEVVIAPKEIDENIPEKPRAPKAPPPIIYVNTYSGESPRNDLSPPQERVVIEKHKPIGSALAFIVAEFLSKRRDKKLEKVIKKESKRTDKIIEQINQSLSAREPESIDSILKRKTYIRERPNAPKRTETATIMPIINRAQESEPKATESVFQTVESLENTPKKEKIYSLNTEKNIHEHKPTSYIETPISSPEDQLKELESAYLSDKISPENSIYKKPLTKRGTTYSQVVGLGMSGYESSYRQNKVIQPIEKLPSDYNLPSVNLSHTYKQSIKIGSGMAILILVLFILVYTLK